MAKEKKEWTPKYTFAPKQAQFNSGGVTMVVVPEKSKVTVQGRIIEDAAVLATVKVGKDNQGYKARNEKEENILFELTKKNDPFGICLFDDRQVPKDQRALIKDRQAETERADKAVNELEEMKKKLKASGVTFDDEGNIKKVV